VPDHVILTWDGGVRLLGLGLSSLIGAAEQPSVAAFCAPEVRAGEPAGPSADAYALAAILWWLIMGRLPPTDGTVPRVSGIGREVPLAVGVGLQRALSSDLKKRIDCRRLASVLQRPARSGKTELAWNMEMLRALSANDPAPSSKAFSRSAKPAPSVDPPSSAIPTPSSPPSRSRHGTPVSRIEQRHRIADALDIEDTDDTGEHIWSRRGDEPSTDDGEPTGQTGRGEDKEPTNPRYLSQPVPAVVTEDESTAGDNEPTTNYHRRVRAREDTEVVPPDVLRRETEADAAAVRKQRWQTLTRPRNLIAVACLAAVVGVERWFASTSTPVEDASPAEVVSEKVATVPSVLPTASASAVAPSGSTAPQETLPHDMGYLMVATDLSVDNAGVYVFGDYLGRANERLIAPCGRVFVRLGTRPPRGAPGRRWLSPGHTTQVVCGAVTIVTIEPYPMVAAPVAAHRPVPARPTARPPAAKPDATWLPDDL